MTMALPMAPTIGSKFPEHCRLSRAIYHFKGPEMVVLKDTLAV